MTYDIQPGDCLLYKPKGIFGLAIKLKTWHAISHVEVYDGKGFSWASRDGIGVNRFPYRESQFAMALRPTQPFDMEKARKWAAGLVGTPYGWGDLLEFVGITHDFPGIVCSPFATLFYRAGGLDPFDGEDAAKIAPFQFSTTSAFAKLAPRVV